ncbi:alpha/beta hydrolase family protein [Polyangium aurulentum]|uniref:alpha/beta hydrolase family protein n=1 Tax=Polyangium aurulentum TaxID=2567896 RepID=UPI0011366F17|nr:hypothetical protein [Polyangium aurulentum]UQA59649.1 hypothetical protein E8A73_003850 [Polyangium aurulentum]
MDPGPKMPDGAPLDAPVDQLGPFRVGYRTFLHTYQPDGLGGPREIRIDLWYPTLDTEGTPPKYLNVFKDDDVLEGATVAPPWDPAGYPVHVHSHGAWAFGGTSADLMHYFASHGWVAIAPNHLGHTLPEHTEDLLPISLRILRSMDISASLDLLEDLPEGDPLAGKCRTDKAFLSGHSAGAQTTWSSAGAAFDMASVQAMCDSGTFAAPCTPEELAIFEAGLGDDRIAAGLPMAGGVGDEPGWFGNDGYDAAKNPFMLMSGTLDPVGAENVWERVKSLDYTWLDFEGGCHQLFALGGCSKLETYEGYALVNTYANAFARRHVLGDTSARVAAILDGSESLSPKVHFQHK